MRGSARADGDRGNGMLTIIIAISIFVVCIAVIPWIDFYITRRYWNWCRKTQDEMDRKCK